MKIAALDELNRLKLEYNKVVKEKGSEIISSVMGEIFSRFPNVRGVHWKQMTPYFNDGDPCEFRVDEPLFELHGADSEDFELEYLSTDNDDDRKFLNAIDKLFSQSSDVFLSLFGDHTKIAAHKTICGEIEFSVEDYSDHD